MNASQWVRQSRKRLRLNQSDVAAYLTFRLRRSCNQARIAEFEKGVSVPPISLLQVMESFFHQVETLRKEKRPWTDVFML